VTAMLTVDNVTKVYRPPPTWLRPLVRTAVKVPVHALQGVSFSADRGEIVGLIGPNGAGKTTLIKVISTLLEPSSGSAHVDGHDVRLNPHEVRKRLGLVLEGDQGLYSRLTGHQNLELYGRLAGMDRSSSRARAIGLLQTSGLMDRDKLVFGYSAGMKMRLSIARAMMSDPPLLILDEPTRSLDPVASRVTLKLFREIAEGDRAVLLSSHRLDEIVAICDTVVAIVSGRVSFVGSPTQLGGSGAEAVAALSDLLEREASRAS
jgi:ABC-2 type transport system ATP-binding protein